MSRKSSHVADLETWKQQVEQTATVFELLALAASASPQLEPLTREPATPAGTPPLSHVAETLRELASSTDAVPRGAKATLRRELRDTSHIVDQMRTLLQHSASTRDAESGAPPPAHSVSVHDPRFLLQDYVPRVERAMGALEHLHANVPRVRPGPAASRPEAGQQPA
jgi:hypothetical protein